MASKRIRKVTDPSLRNDGEPTPSLGSKLEMIDALSWYSYNKDNSNYKSWLLEYMKGKFPSNTIQSVTQNIGMISGTWAAVARMESRGIKTGSDLSLRDYLTEFAVKYKVEDDITQPVKNAISIQDRVDGSCTKYINFIDEQIDNFILGNKYSMEFYDGLNAAGCKAAHVRIIKKYYQQSFDNVAALAASDPTILEYYQGYGKQGKKAIIEFYTALENDLSKLEQTKKASRVRKVKKPSIEKIVSKVKYCKESSEFKVGSIHPQKVLGGEQLWVFNTKTRQLGRYNGSNFNFKRSTLSNFEPDTSVSKKLRKPEEFLKTVLNATKSQLNKQFDGIKAVAKPMNGRLNEFNILLRVW